MKLKALVLFTVMYLSLSTSAQVLNIEKKRLDQDTISKVLGNFSALFHIQKQQGTITDVDLDANIAKLTTLHSYLLIGNLKFIKARGQEVTSRGHVHGRSVFFRKQLVSPEVFAQLQYDDLRGMSQRKLAGAGPHFRVLSKDKIHVTTGTSLMYEYESWDFNNQKEKTELFKSSNYISCHISLNNFHYNGAVYYQRKFDFSESYRFLTDHYMSIDLSKKVSFLIKFNQWFDSTPIIEGIHRSTYNLTTGLKIKF